MSHDQKKHVEEESGESVGLWYVSFADMITLLLAFFVMMTSFSAYSRDSRLKLMEAFDYINLYAFYHTAEQKQAIVRHIERVIDETPVGADKRTDTELTVISPPPKRQEIESENAYCERNTVRIPADQIFRGTGSTISDQGTAMLTMVANYLKLMTGNKIVVSMSGGDSPEIKIQKSLAVVDYLTTQNVKPDRFFVSSSPAFDTTGKIFRPFVELAIMRDTLQ